VKRRGFLRFLGSAALLGVVATQAVARPLLRRSSAADWPHPQDGVTAYGLMKAIEALFPAGAILGQPKAYQEFGGPVVFRAVHRTFALGYVGTPDDAVRRRALYRAMYQTWVQMAQRPENQGAQLVWRSTPYERFDRGLDFERDASEPEPKVTLRMRAALLPMGWRRALQVEPWVGGDAMRSEGAATVMVG
jgi:hypothetical protein